MDKDSQTHHSKPDLPHTPRVSKKVLEYYQQFGQERDLEKYMRLYSPASSQSSGKNEGNDCVSAKSSVYKRTKSGESVASNNSREILAMMPSRPLNVCCEVNSKSLPNIDIQGKVFAKDDLAASSDVTVDINIEATGEKEKILSISTENLKTPKKTFRSTKTQTPESVAKTHRRLEWDSLGDVGYKKSMSTSNISIVERSLLREFFKEKNAMSEQNPSSRKDLCKERKSIEKFIATEKEHSTPPLASSTLVNPTEIGSKPKMLSHSTSSTSLTEKFEKYVQTSIIKPPTVRSQEIQCTLSSAYSKAEGTATPSSFEYYSSRSSKSSDNMVSVSTLNRLQPQEHPFITSITDLLIKRRALGEKNQQSGHQLNDIRDLQAKFQAALDGNKENQTHITVDSSSTTSFSLSKHAPELDLGIQLICALIDAKSINGRQKKQLIRDIMKRLTRIENKEKTEISSTASSSQRTVSSSGDTAANSSSFNHHQNVYDSVRSGNHKNAQRNAIKSLELGVSPLKNEHTDAKEKSTTSTDNGSDVLAAKRPVSRPPKFHASCPFQQQDKVRCEHFPITKNRSQKHINVPSVAAEKINKETQCELIMREQNTCKSKQTEAYCKLTPDTPEKTCLKLNSCTQTSKISSTSSTPDLTTQKLNKTHENPEPNSSKTDADQPTMREWLNPLTQSEIEYEEKKKQTEIKKKAAAPQEKFMKKVRHDCGRVQQLSWIENEIKRLECLKHLLLKDETATNSTTSASSDVDSQHKSSFKNSLQTEKLYDTVYTDKSSVLSESAEQLVQEIEIILEESNEDVINVKDNFKRSKERKKETQIIYEKEKNSLKSTDTKPRLRIIKENTSTHEEQLFTNKPTEMSTKIQKQREKIDTPSTDTSKEGSDTLKDLVQQRKREFLEAYKSKRQHHYDALKQQQKNFKYLNLPQKVDEKSATTTDSEHYSVPHQYNTIPGKYTTNDVSYYTQHPPAIASTEKLAQISEPQLKETHISKPANAHKSATNSSSSMFCMSSEISVPMGSQDTSSYSPSSTHPYNDKATVAAKAGVAIQTSDSLRLSKPIYGPGPAPAPPHPTSIPHNPTAFSSTACIQVKPKGIAYVIEFDANKQTSEAEPNSNDSFTKPSAKTDRSSAVPKTTINLKTSLANDQQLLTLQQHLEKSRPKFLKHSKERKAILNQLQSMRQERVRQLREIIENTSLNSLDRRLQYLPPPPMQKVRILRTKDMKALTNKRFTSLPEVVAKQEREIEEKKRRSNRILRDVFNKRLQKRVRNGKLSLNHSKTVV